MVALPSDEKVSDGSQARGADDVIRDSRTGLSSIAWATEEAAIPRPLAIYRSCL
jgi:hypothetical protein